MLGHKMKNNAKLNGEKSSKKKNKHFVLLFLPSLKENLNINIYVCCTTNNNEIIIVNETSSLSETFKLFLSISLFVPFIVAGASISVCLFKLQMTLSDIIKNNYSVPGKKTESQSE